MPSLQSELSKLPRAVERHLYTLAVDAMRATDCQVSAAARKLVESAMIKRDVLYALAEHYLETRVAPDMRGDALLSGDRYAHAGNGQSACAPAQQSNEGGMGQARHVDGDDPTVLAQPSSPNESDGVSRAMLSDGRESLTPSLSPKHDGAGHLNRAKRQTRLARPVRVPTPSQRAAALKVAARASITVLDTYRIRDGRPIGEVTYGELERLRSTNSQESWLIRQIQRHGSANPETKVRDMLKPEDLQRMIQKAAELADAA